jgi:hypothetical protein
MYRHTESTLDGAHPELCRLGKLLSFGSFIIYLFLQFSIVNTFAYLHMSSNGEHVDCSELELFDNSEPLSGNFAKSGT